MLLKDKVAIVTGGASGIGRAIALGFADEGAAVVIADIDDEKAGSAVAEIEGKGGKAVALKVDVTDVPALYKMADDVLSLFGRIDIFVHSAGYSKSAPLVEADIADWDKTFDTNVRGALFGVKAVKPAMLEQGGGKIILMTSLAAWRGRPQQQAYCSASGVLTILTQNLAHQLGPDHIYVNAIAPGLIDTGFDELAADGTDEERAERITHTPLRRAGRPEDVVQPAVFLASSMSDYVTGTTLVVDGGMQIHLSGLE